MLAVAVAGGGGSEEDGVDRSKGDTARCFPDKIAMFCTMCVFVP